VSTYHDTNKDEINLFNFNAMLGRIGSVMYIFSGNPAIIKMQSEARNHGKY